MWGLLSGELAIETQLDDLNRTISQRVVGFDFLSGSVLADDVSAEKR